MPYIPSDQRAIELDEDGVPVFSRMSDMFAARADFRSQKPELLRDFSERLLNLCCSEPVFEEEDMVLEDSLHALAVILLKNISKASRDSGKGPEGMLNYCLTRMMNTLYPAPSYAVFNEIMGIFASLQRRASPSHIQALGILSACQAEYYRKRVAPYEDAKELENGAV